MDIWVELKNEVLENMLQRHGMPIDAKKWVQDFIEYNCAGGKLNRGLSLLQWYTVQYEMWAHVLTT